MVFWLGDGWKHLFFVNTTYVNCSPFATSCSCSIRTSQNSVSPVSQAGRCLENAGAFFLFRPVGSFKPLFGWEKQQLFFWLLRCWWLLICSVFCWLWSQVWVWLGDPKGAKGPSWLTSHMDPYGIQESSLANGHSTRIWPYHGWKGMKNWCVLNAGNGWGAGGCWNMLGSSWMIFVDHSLIPYVKRTSKKRWICNCQVHFTQRLAEVFLCFLPNHWNGRLEPKLPLFIIVPITTIYHIFWGDPSFWDPKSYPLVLWA